MKIKILSVNDFVSFIKKVRYDKHISQAKLGSLCGLKQQYIYQIESGKVIPTLPTMVRIAEALGYAISVEEC